jgi:hypothetical protein
MNSRLPRRKPHTAIAAYPSSPSTQTRREPRKSSRDRFNQTWDELRISNTAKIHASDLSKLIEHDAPLRNHSGLVLMYGPFQTEMQPTNGQGVASWLRDCVHKYGLPSLVRYDDRRRAQVFRRDQFQPWLEPLVAKMPG